jgi:hypothetical protein
VSTPTSLASARQCLILFTKLIVFEILKVTSSYDIMPILIFRSFYLKNSSLHFDFQADITKAGQNELIKKYI